MVVAIVCVRNIHTSEAAGSGTVHESTSEPVPVHEIAPVHESASEITQALEFIPVLVPACEFLDCSVLTTEVIQELPVCFGANREGCL